MAVHTPALMAARIHRALVFFARSSVRSRDLWGLSSGDDIQVQSIPDGLPVLPVLRIGNQCWMPKIMSDNQVAGDSLCFPA